MAAPSVVSTFELLTTGFKKKVVVADVRINIVGNCKPAKLEITQQKDGGFLVTYILAMSGKYRIDISVQGVTAEEDYRISCLPPRVDVTNTTLSDNGKGSRNGFLGELCSFQITALDQFGLQMKSGGDTFAADVMDGDSDEVLFPADIADLGDGTYDLSFYPEVAGLYRLAITCRGEPLQGSPYEVIVRKDETVAARCKAVGIGLALGTVGEPNTFTLQAIDGKGSTRTTGGDYFKVEARSLWATEEAPLTIGHVTDHFNGTYTVSWETEISGQHSIEITLYGEHVDESPYTCTISAGAIDGSKSECYGEGLRRAAAGTSSNFTIVARDKFGNQREAAGDANNIKVFLLDPGRPNWTGLAGRVDITSDGECLGSYIPTHAGSYEVGVFVHGTHVKGSPFPCKVAPGGMDVVASKLYGPGLDHVELGRPSKIFIEPCDSYGNAVSSRLGEGLVIAVQGPQGPVEVVPLPEEPEVFGVAYVATAPGAYTVSACFNGVHIKRSPCVVMASTAAAVAELCEVDTGFAERTSTVVAGQKAEFAIHAKDAKGVMKSIGGDIFSVAIQAPDGQQLTGKVLDHGNGSYMASFSGSTAGLHQVSVYLKDSAVAGSPFSMSVAPGPVDAARSMLHADSVAVKAGNSAALHIQLHDGHGNNVPCTDWSKFKVESSGPGAASVTVKPTGEVLMHTTCAGVYSVGCVYQDQHLSGSPAKVEVAAGTACAANASLISVPPAAIPAGSELLLEVAAQDVFGNTCSAAKVEVMLETGRGSSALVPAAYVDGRFVARSNVPGSTGLLTYTVLVNGAVLESTPTTVQVAAGAAASWTPGWRDTLQSVAGERVAARVYMQDAHGNRLSRGGHRLSAAVSANSESTPESAVVEDRGDGSYLISFTRKTTGEYSLYVVLSEGAEDRTVVYSGRCAPGKLAPGKCRVDGPVTPATAGKPHVLLLHMHDTQGNRIQLAEEGAHPWHVHVAGSGPGPLETQVVPREPGCEVHSTAYVSGEYSVSLTCKATGAVVGEGPVKLVVVPAAADPGSCHARLGSEDGVVCAGEALSVVVEAHDRYGNAVAKFDGSQVSAVARGPSEVKLQQAATREPGGGAVELQGNLKVAGSYVVHVLVSGQPVGGWPRLMRVAPGAAAAKHCEVKSTVLEEGAECGKAFEVLVQARDKCNNTCTAGQSEVEMVMIGPDGRRVRGAVHDHEDGSYMAQLMVEHAGAWVLQVTVGGEAVREGGYPVDVQYGQLLAGDCVVSGLTGTVACGDSTAVRVHAGELAEGRKLTGHEALSMVVMMPSGWSQRVEMKLVEAGTYMKGSFECAEAGVYEVAITAAGKAVPGSPFSVRASAQKVCLSHSQVRDPGFREAVAGERAEVVFEAWDADGNVMCSGGASFKLEVVSHGAKHLGEVQDIGGGTYRAIYVVETAGEYEVWLELEGTEERCMYRGRCLPGKTEAGRCTVKGASTKVKEAGQVCELWVLRRDAYGNEVLAADGWSVLASASGPGPMQTQVVDYEETHAIRCTPSTAGEYSVALTCKATGAVVGEGPVKLVVVPAAAEPGSCHARLGSEDGVVCAGEALSVVVEAHDRYGNAVAEFDGSQVSAVARGPSEVKLQQAATREPGGGAVELQGNLKVAGSYVVHVLVSGQPVGGWPRLMRVAPGAAAAKHCEVKSTVLEEGAECGKAFEVLVQARDKCNNTCTAGQSEVEMVMIGPDGRRVRGAVHDHEDGSYMAQLMVEHAGAWVLQVTVGGEAVREGGYPVDVQYGQLLAGDCVVSGLTGTVACGDSTAVRVHAGELAEGRKLTGHEALSMVVMMPSGWSQRVEMKLVEAGTSMEGTVQWVEAGVYEVAITAAGKAVPGSPFSVRASAQKVCLSHSQVRDPGFREAVAGERAEVVFEAWDADGNVMCSGGASFKLEVVSHGAKHLGEVQDIGGGTYRAIYVVETAGEYEVWLELEGTEERCMYRGRCLPGKTEAGRCTVKGASTKVKEAGQVCELWVLRRDAYGNEVLAADGWSVLASASGPGPMQTHVFERDDGCLEVQCKASISGEYSVALTCKATGAVVGEGPVKLVVVPAAADPGSFRARLGSEDGVVWAGEALSVVVEAHDRYGNAVAEFDGSQVSAVARGPSEVKLQQAATREPGGGAVELQGNLKVAGSYVVHVLVSGQPVGGWPRLMRVAPGAAAAKHCEVKSTVLEEGAECGKAFEVLVQARDKCNNMCMLGQSEVEMVMIGPDGRRVRGAVHDHEDGSYMAQLMVEHAGAWVLQVTVGGEAVREGGYPVDVQYGQLLAGDCVVSGLTGTVACGDSTAVRVHAGELAEGRKLTGHEALSMVVMMPSGWSQRVEMKLVEAGTSMEGTVQWVEAGQHTVAITLGGSPLLDAPLSVLVDPGAADALHSELSCLEQEPLCGTPVHLEVTFRDCFGNVAVASQEDVSLLCTPSNAAEVTEAPRKPGVPVRRMQFSVTGSMACSVMVEARIRGVRMMGSPLTLLFSAGELNVSMTRPLSQATLSCTAGEPASWLLQACDADGNALSRGGASLEATVEQEKGCISAAVRDHGDGTYEVQYLCECAGPYALRLRQKTTSASPEEPASCAFAGRCAPGPLCAARCHVEHAGAGASTVAGAVGRLTVALQDRLGNTVAAQDADVQGARAVLRLTASGPGVMEAQAVGIQAGEGAHMEVRYEARVCGEYLLSLRDAASGEELPESPVRVVIAPAAAALNRCRMHLVGGTTVLAGEEVTLAVDVRDSYGNKAPTVAVLASLHGPGGKVLLTPCSDNPALLRAPLTLAGDYNVRAVLKESPLETVSSGTGALRVHVAAGPAWPGGTLIHGVPEELRAGTAHELRITPCDRQGNPGASQAMVSVQMQKVGGREEEVQHCQLVRDDATGVYTATVAALVAGDACLTVSVRREGAEAGAGEHVVETRLRIVESETCVAECTTSGLWPAVGAIVRQPAGLVITARDECGNQRPCGGDKFVVQLQGSTSGGMPADIRVEDRGDGTYGVEMLVAEPGRYSVNITSCGRHIRGSPLSMVVYQDIVALAEQEMDRRLNSCMSNLRQGIAETRQLHGSLMAESQALKNFIPVLLQSAQRGISDVRPDPPSRSPTLRQLLAAAGLGAACSACFPGYPGLGSSGGLGGMKRLSSKS
ncbi:hypothetical protein CYMTET_19249 [Cymbomonas tetramitiformis]|uniref:Uncharacterized protein n=1 Tax=Cymbomonas tetramitiformis TaxID=36881 RepID=A0AAE0G6G0_9CHLO|nr:hypothetical protein CYMTET_19249 [Cymbomonas tetramitiformis]